MAEFVLVCDCDSTDFEYHDVGEFKCNDCGLMLPDKIAGQHLIEKL